MNIYLFAASFVLSAIMAMVVIPRILLISYKRKLFDMPDERKVHKVPVPRLGGVSFFPVIVITMSVMLGMCLFLDLSVTTIPWKQVSVELLFFVAGGMMLFLVGVADDFVGVRFTSKFAAQILTAILIVLPGNWINSLSGLFGIYAIPAWFGIPLTILIIVYITNAINLIDGLDGLASGLCCISLVSLSFIFVTRGEIVFAMLAVSALGVVVPFWFYNVFGNEQKGHKLFMGDTGSLTLGYLLSFLVVHLSRLQTVEPGQVNVDMVVAFSTLFVPLIDVVRVVLKRVRLGKNPFLPDKNHFHHKLLKTGLNIRAVLIIIICVSLFFIMLNIVLVRRMDITLLFVLNIVLWTGMHLGINEFIKHKNGGEIQE